MGHRVLIVTTSTGEAGPDGPETGFDWQSLAVPYWRLRSAGAEIGFASVKGGKPPGDPESAGDPRIGAVEMFLGASDAVESLAESHGVGTEEAARWHAALLTDGAGGLWDLAQSKALSAFLTALWARGGVIAAIGAGTAGLLSVRTDGDHALASGRRVAAPPDARYEDLAGGAPPVLPASGLIRQGAQVVSAAPGEEAEVIDDGRLITAEDARGSGELALQLLDALDVHVPAMVETEVVPTEDGDDT